MKQLHNESIYIERIVRPPKFKMKNDHMHAYFELYYLLDGTRKCFINHSFYTLNPHDMMLIRGGDLHHTSYLTDHSHERIVIYFDEFELERLYNKYGKETILSCFQYPKCSIPKKDQPYLLELLTFMSAQQELIDEFSAAILQNRLEELLLYLLRLQRTSKHELDEPVEDSDITTAARYICENFKQELTLDDVAQKVNMSTTYFSKKFKAMTGFGFKEYLNTIRLKEAARKLKDTSEPITEIALECGFNDSNYFGDIFKKVYGISPRGYRKDGMTTSPWDKLCNAE
ncbi:MAG: AraC family transcriptional regulator [bacterium]|nr:AraC family transcriptional regulator [bacterium]